uniref:Proteasome maturation factor UMP1 n=1 Tax=Kalanchoe fedtschenkoi TaxID=63787 RepID=A0A7N0T8R0_KALFE
MEAPKSIPHEIGGLKNDALRFGLHGVKSDIVGADPLESAFKSTKMKDEVIKRKVLATTYGTAFPVKLELERQILSRFQRLPGAIPSSMLGFESLTGDLDNFGFEDYLNDPRESETFRSVDMHHAVEVRLGLSKGLVAPSFI